MNKIVYLFIICLLKSFSIFGQFQYVRPINIRDCNIHEAIFVGQVLGKRQIGKSLFVLFEIEEEFKYRDTLCQIVLKEWGYYSDEERFVRGEKWLIFATKYKNQYYFDSDRSWRFLEISPLDELIFKLSLEYLREFTLSPTQYVNESFMASMEGCVTDKNVYSGRGNLVEGYPNGEWIFRNDTEDCIESKIFYRMGIKWGISEGYHENGFIGSKKIYYNDQVVKQILYDSWGELYCFNDECSLWNGRNGNVITTLFKEEEHAYCSSDY